MHFAFCSTDNILWEQLSRINHSNVKIFLPIKDKLIVLFGDRIFSELNLFILFPLRINWITSIRCLKIRDLKFFTLVLNLHSEHFFSYGKTLITLLYKVTDF